MPAGRQVQGGAGRHLCRGALPAAWASSCLAPGLGVQAGVRILQTWAGPRHQQLSQEHLCPG